MSGVLSVTEQKKSLRSKMREIRNGMPCAVRAAYDRAIAEAVIAHPGYLRAKQVFVYAAMPWEVQTQRILQQTLDCGKILALPVCETDRHTMTFYRLDTLDELEVGAYRIPIPPISEERICVPDGDTLMILPMMAYDRLGYRLGAGGGYYDRFLAQYPSVRTLGICYSDCTAESLPHDIYDRKMQACITENGTEEFHG